MAVTQTGKAERGTPIPQKGEVTRNPKTITKAETQEVMDALKIVPQAATLPRLTTMRFKDPKDPQHKLTFHQLVECHVMAAQAEKDAKAIKDAASKDMCAALAAIGRSDVMDGEVKITIVNGHSAAHVDARKLFELGVDEKVIAAATKMGGDYSYALVTPPKQVKEGK